MNYGGLISSLAIPQPILPWIGVRSRFNQFLANLTPTQNQIDDALTKLRGITSCLNAAYWNSLSETENSLIVGSWGKGTCIRPPTDAEMIFLRKRRRVRLCTRRTNIQTSARKEQDSPQ